MLTMHYWYLHYYALCGWTFAPLAPPTHFSTYYSILLHEVTQDGLGYSELWVTI